MKRSYFTAPPVKRRLHLQARPALRRFGAPCASAQGVTKAIVGCKRLLGFSTYSILQSSTSFPSSPMTCFTSSSKVSPNIVSPVAEMLRAPIINRLSNVGFTCKRVWRSLCVSTSCDRRDCLVQGFVRKRIANPSSLNDTGLRADMLQYRSLQFG
jgi:hypothetical protein